MLNATNKWKQKERKHKTFAIYFSILPDFWLSTSMKNVGFRLLAFNFPLVPAIQYSYILRLLLVDILYNWTQNRIVHVYLCNIYHGLL